MADHRYWRIYGHLTPGMVNRMTVAELELRTSVGGSQAATGGTALSGTFYNANYAASKAFDGTLYTTYWICLGNHDANGDFGYFHDWLGYDFGEGNDVDIVEIAICPRESYPNDSPKNVVLEYSDDGTNWYPKSYAINISYSESTKEVITLTATSGPDKYKFLFDDFPAAYRNYAAIAEIEFRESVDGADTIDDSNAYGISSTYINAASFIIKTIDGNAATVWHSANVVDETAHWIEYWFFSKQIDLVEYQITARNDMYAPNDTPIAWRLQKWNYSTEAWDTIDTIIGEAAWSAGESRQYVVGSSKAQRCSFFLMFPNF